MDVKTLELKAIKVLASRSEETFCYTASVYLNGKKAMTVGNGGHGACDDQDEIIPGSHQAIDDFLKTQNSASALFVRGEVSIHYHCLEYWCSALVGEFLTNQDLKRAYNKDRKKELMFIKDGSLVSVDLKQNGRLFPVEDVAKVMRKRHGENLVILNLLSAEEALKLYAEHVLEKPKNESDVISDWNIPFTPEFNDKGECTNAPTKKDFEEQGKRTT